MRDERQANSPHTGLALLAGSHALVIRPPSPTLCAHAVSIRIVEVVTSASVESGDEPELVVIALAVRAGVLPPEALDSAFDRAVVYAQCPPNPGLFVADVPGYGAWAYVFSTPSRLAAHAGNGHYLSTTGADLLDQVPAGTGVMLDVADDHRYPILSRVVPPKILAAMRRHMNAQRTGAAQSMDHDTQTAEGDT
jgi:hypothetical protein